MLKRLKIYQKFALIAVAFTIPIVVLLYLLFVEQSKGITFGRLERDGVEYLSPLKKLEMDLAIHRDEAQAFLGGDATFKDEVTKVESDIEADFRDVAAADKRFDDPDCTDALNALRQEWSQLQTSATLKADQSFDAHTKLIHDTQQLAFLVGDRSNLVHDPDSDSYYAMDLIMFKIPKLNEELSQARAKGANSVAAGANPLTPDRRGELASLQVVATDSLTNLSEGLKAMIEEDPDAGNTLAKEIPDAVGKSRTLLDTLGQKIVTPTTPQITTSAYFDTANDAIDANYKLYDGVSKILDELLQARIDMLSRNRTTSLLFVALAVGLTILLLFFVVRAITKPIAHLTQVAERISLGEMDAEIAIDSKDEIGQLGEQFRRLQVSLKAAMDQLEQRDSAEG